MNRDHKPGSKSPACPKCGIGSPHLGCLCEDNLAAGLEPQPAAVPEPKALTAAQTRQMFAAEDRSADNAAEQELRRSRLAKSPNVP